MALVFQYGSNTSIQRLNSKARLDGSAKFIGIVYTADKFELDFTVYSDYNKCAAADIVPKEEGRNIWGILYDIPEERIYREKSIGLTTLDDVEGEGSLYIRKLINVKYPNGDLLDEPVITYVVKNKKNGLKTSLEYVSHILKGLKSNSIPNEYIEYVKSRIIINNPALKEEIEKL